jgi:hypothetical protein
VREWGWLRPDLPEWHTLQPVAAGLSVLAMIALLRLHIGLGWTLLGSALLGLLLTI